VNVTSPCMKFFAGMLAAAAAIRLSFILLMPVLPELLVVCAAVAAWRLWSWHRDRW
jgi:hypothetical protein